MNNDEKRQKISASGWTSERNQANSLEYPNARVLGKGDAGLPPYRLTKGWL